MIVVRCVTVFSFVVCPSGTIGVKMKYSRIFWNEIKNFCYICACRKKEEVWKKGFLGQVDNLWEQLGNKE